MYELFKNNMVQKKNNNSFRCYINLKNKLQDYATKTQSTLCFRPSNILYRKHFRIKNNFRFTQDGGLSSAILLHFLRTIPN